MSSEILEQIRAHKNFYRDNFRRGCNALAIVLVFALMLAVVALYIYVTRPLPDFYATSSSGEIAPLTSLPQPNYSHEPLIK